MALDGYGPNLGAYAQEESDLGYRYNTDRASNAYGRFLSQQRGSRGLSDMSTQFNRGLPHYRAQFGQRGLMGPGVRSGSMQRSMGNMLGDYARDYGRAQADMTQEAQNYDLTGAQLDAQYNSGLSDIRRRKQQEIARSALAIEALRPYLGGV